MAETRRFCLVTTTTGSEEQAREIARALVERELAACVHLVPRVCSIYRYEGKISEDEERVLWIKTAVDLFPEVCRVIRELHTYDLPELIQVPIDGGDPDVLAWLDGALKKG
mgnify:CR=1 FL=1